MIESQIIPPWPDFKRAKEISRALVVCPEWYPVGGSCLTQRCGITGFYHHLTPQELSHELGIPRFRPVFAKAHSHASALINSRMPENNHSYSSPSGDGDESFCDRHRRTHCGDWKDSGGLQLERLLLSFCAFPTAISATNCTRDYEEMINGLHAARRRSEGAPGSCRVVLRGGYSVLVATDPIVENAWTESSAISLRFMTNLPGNLPTHSFKRYSPALHARKYIDARQFVTKLDPVPIVILNATDD